MTDRRRDCGGEGGADDAAFHPEAPTEPSMLDSHDLTIVCVSSVSSVSIAMSVMC